jgi:tRNA A-37 threonylcarbamoyl transferase component Bud32
MATSSPSPAETPTSTGTLTTRVVDLKRLQLARRAWVVIAAYSVIYALLNWGLYTVGRLEPCLAEPCAHPQLSPQAAITFEQSGIPFALAALLRPLSELLWMTVYIGVGILIYRRRSDDWMGLLVSLMLCLLGPQLTYSIETLQVTDAAWQWVSTPLTIAMLVLTYAALYLLPDGTFVPRWSKGLLVVSLCIEVPRGILTNTTLSGDFLGYVLVFALILTAIGLGLQIRRYRRLPQANRQQMKWLLFGGALLMVGLALSIFQRLFLPDFSGLTYIALSLIALLAQVTVYLGLPVAFAFSILRYRLWEADLVINRSLVYVTSFVVIGSMIGGLSVLISIGLTGLVGQERTWAWPLVVSLAAAAALFAPISRRLAAFIDRQVYGLRVELAQIEQQSREASLKSDPMPEVRAGGFAGRRVGAYQLVRLLGRGAMSEVYSANEPNSGLPVAVKILPPEHAGKPKLVQRFQREAEALKRIDHPNVVRLMGSGMTDGTFFVVMELVAGQTLADWMRADANISREAALTVIQDIAAGLDAAHDAGLVHRDVKPANVLLRQSNERTHAVLSDFGIVKLMDAEAGGEEDSFIGTMYYVAPEQIKTAKSVDHRADIYALGVIAYQLLTGQHPFDGSPTALLFSHLNQPPADPRTLKPSLPKATAQAVLRALAKKPEERYQTAGAFAAALMGQTIPA